MKEKYKEGEKLSREQMLEVQNLIDQSERWERERKARQRSKRKEMKRLRHAGVGEGYRSKYS